MPVTDTEQLVRQAIVTILTANAALQTAIGRATADIVIERGQFAPGQSLPVLAYDFEGFAPDEESTLVLSAVTDEPEGSIKCRAILEAAVAALTSDAFAGQSLDVVVYNEHRASVDLDDQRRIGQPNLQQADAVLTLLQLT